MSDVALDHDALAAAMLIALGVSLLGTVAVAIFCKRAKGDDDVTGFGVADREPNLTTPVAVTKNGNEYCPKCEMSVEHRDCVYGPGPKGAA